MPSQIAEGLAAVKLGIVVLPAVAIAANPNQFPLYFEKLRLSCHVVESGLNKGLEAEEVAELLHAYLHGWQLPPEIPGRPMLFSDEVPMEAGEIEGTYYVACHFITHGLAPFQN